MLFEFFFYTGISDDRNLGALGSDPEGVEQ
jgi:hypothetical protein